MIKTTDPLSIISVKGINIKTEKILRVWLYVMPCLLVVMIMIIVASILQLPWLIGISVMFASVVYAVVPYMLYKIFYLCVVIDLYKNSIKDLVLYKESKIFMAILFLSAFAWLMAATFFYPLILYFVLRARFKKLLSVQAESKAQAELAALTASEEQPVTF